MENFIYSLNATVPVFLVILAGYFLKETGMLTSAFVASANKFNFQVTLPALLFQDIVKADIFHQFDIKYVAFCAIATTICFFCIWFAAKKIVKDTSMTGAFVQASFRGSAAVLGIAFIQNMYGNAGMAPIMIIGAVPLYNIYSVIVLTFEGQEGKKENIKNALANICKNPIIIGIAAGIIVSALGIQFPEMIDKSINNFAVMASPLALIAIGAGFEYKNALARMKPAIIASIIKLILQPLLFLPIAVLLGFRTEKLIALLIMLGAPTTASSYIMAKNMNNDADLTTGVIVLTTLFSSVTITFWIFLLKSFQII